MLFFHQARQLSFAHSTSHCKAQDILYPVTAVICHKRFPFGQTTLVVLIGQEASSTAQWIWITKMRDKILQKRKLNLKQYVCRTVTIQSLWYLWALSQCGGYWNPEHYVTGHYLWVKEVRLPDTKRMRWIFAIKNVAFVLASLWSKRKGKSQIWTFQFIILWREEPSLSRCHSAPATSRGTARNCICPWSGLCSSP